MNKNMLPQMQCQRNYKNTCFKSKFHKEENKSTF